MHKRYYVIVKTFKIGMPSPVRKELPEDWQRHSGRMVRVKRERWRSLLRPLQHRRVHRVRKGLCGLCFAQHSAL